MTQTVRIAQAKICPAYVAEIKRLHEGIIGAGRTVLAHAIRVGELLTKIKAQLPHGEWLPWLKRNVTFDRSTAANYMRVYERREELKCRNILHLGRAYKLLAHGKSRPLNDSERMNAQLVEQLEALLRAESWVNAVQASVEIRAKIGPSESVCSVPNTREAILERIQKLRSLCVRKPTRGLPRGAVKSSSNILKKQRGLEADETGHPIPPDAQRFWDRRFEPRTHANTIHEVRAALEHARAKADPLFASIDLGKCLTALETVCAELSAATPFAVCPHCQGIKVKGCAKCRGCGLISEIEWNALPSEVRRAARLNNDQT